MLSPCRELYSFLLKARPCTFSYYQNFSVLSRLYSLVIIDSASHTHRNASLPKSYRIISLLNCLGKISEKIIARRLVFLANTTNIIHFNQMNSRKQISVINAIMILVHDI